MEIPAVVATNVITETVNDGDMVVLDGLTGDVFVNPDEETVSTYEAKRKEFEDYKAELKTLKTAESVSTDGHKVLLVANIGSPNDIVYSELNSYIWNQMNFQQKIHSMKLIRQYLKT